MKCEKCGKEIDGILVDEFLRDANTDVKYPFKEEPENAVVIDVNRNWTGYELSEEERIDTIRCPHCKQFPFICEEIQEEEIVRLVLFKGNDNPDRKPTNLDRIKNMTVDELAELLGTKACECCAYLSFSPCGFGAPACEEGIKKWLEQEAEE